MRRLLLSMLLFVLLGVGLAVALARVSYWRPSGDMIARIGYQHRIQRLLGEADQIEALAAGHSLNMAISFDGLGLNGYHIWHMGSDFFDVDYQIRALLPHLPQLEYVFIPISFDDFGRDNGDRPEGRRIRVFHYAAFSHVAPFRLIDGDYKHRIQEVLLPLVRDDHWKPVFDGLRGKRSHHATRLELATQETPYGYIGPSREKTGSRETAEHFGEIEAAKLRMQPPEDLQIMKRTSHQLAATLALLQARGVQVVLYTPPLTDVLYGHYTALRSAQMQGTRQMVRQLASAHDAIYLDFSADPEFSTSYHLFADTHHMNAEGADLFSKKLIEHVRAWEKQAGTSVER